MAVYVVLSKSMDNLDYVKMFVEWRACENARKPRIDQLCMFSFPFSLTKIRIHGQNFLQNQSFSL